MAERRKRSRKSTFHYTQVLDRNSGKQIGRLVNITTEGMMLITKTPLGTGTAKSWDALLEGRQPSQGVEGALA